MGVDADPSQVRIRVERKKPVAESDATRVDSRKVRVPIVVVRPRQQQRVRGTRKPVERGAKMEVAELNERRVGREQSDSAVGAGDRGEGLHCRPVPASLRKLVGIDRDDGPGRVEPCVPSFSQLERNSKVNGLRTFVRFELELTLDSEDWTLVLENDRVRPIAAGDGWHEESTGLHPLEFIETRRHWFTSAVEHETGATVNVLNLVEGAAALVESPTDASEPMTVHYAETFVVPAAVGAYRVRPLAGAPSSPLATIKAYVRPPARR